MVYPKVLVRQKVRELIELDEEYKPKMDDNLVELFLEGSIQISYNPETQELGFRLTNEKYQSMVKEKKKVE